MERPIAPFLLVADHSSPPFQQHAVTMNMGYLPTMGRYSAEEWQERIDKYRSKRRHRNFNKRIIYAYWKRLADGWARVNGRFDSRTNDGGGEGVAVDDTPLLLNPNNNIDATEAMTTAMPEWWPQMQVELDNREEEMLCTSGVNDLHLCDTKKIEMFAAYLDVSSMDLSAYLQ
ncbi:hypothetical protein ABZP36_034428 [Zizania latifolia]